MGGQTGDSWGPRESTWNPHDSRWGPSDSKNLVADQCHVCLYSRRTVSKHCFCSNCRWFADYKLEPMSSFMDRDLRPRGDVVLLDTQCLWANSDTRKGCQCRNCFHSAERNHYNTIPNPTICNNCMYSLCPAWCSARRQTKSEAKSPGVIQDYFATTRLAGNTTADPFATATAATATAAAPPIMWNVPLVRVERVDVPAADLPIGFAPFAPLGAASGTQAHPQPHPLPHGAEYDSVSKAQRAIESQGFANGNASAGSPSSVPLFCSDDFTDAVISGVAAARLAPTARAAAPSPISSLQHTQVQSTAAQHSQHSQVQAAPALAPLRHMTKRPPLVGAAPIPPTPPVKPYGLMQSMFGDCLPSRDAEQIRTLKQVIKRLIEEKQAVQEELNKFFDYNVLNHKTMAKLERTIFDRDTQLSHQKQKLATQEQQLNQFLVENKSLKERLQDSVVLKDTGLLTTSSFPSPAAIADLYSNLVTNLRTHIMDALGSPIMEPPEFGNLSCFVCTLLVVAWRDGSTAPSELVKNLLVPKSSESKTVANASSSTATATAAAPTAVAATETATTLATAAAKAETEKVTIVDEKTQESIMKPAMSFWRRHNYNAMDVLPPMNFARISEIAQNFGVVLPDATHDLLAKFAKETSRIAWLAELSVPPLAIGFNDNKYDDTKHTREWQDAAPAKVANGAKILRHNYPLLCGNGAILVKGEVLVETKQSQVGQR